MMIKHWESSNRFLLVDIQFSLESRFSLASFVYEESTVNFNVVDLFL